MAQLNRDDLDYVVDDYSDFADFDRNSFGITKPERVHDSEFCDSDFEDEFETSKPNTDTSAYEAKNGKDIQGIPWERLKYTRDEFRKTRLKQYENFENLLNSREKLDEESLQVDKGKNFYNFQFNMRLVKSTIVHFQVDSLYLEECFR